MDDDTFADDKLGEGEIDLSQYRGKPFDQQGSQIITQQSLRSDWMGNQLAGLRFASMMLPEGSAGRTSGADKISQEATTGTSKEDKEGKEDLAATTGISKEDKEDSVAISLEDKVTRET